MAVDVLTTSAVTISGRLRKPLAAALIALGAAAAAWLLGRAPLFRAMDWKVYDLEMRTAADAREANADIVLIEIDDRSIERMAENGFGRFPWPRDTFAALLRYLERGRPRSITFDLLFLEEDTSAEGPARDRELVDATRRLGNVVHSVEVNDTHEYDPALRLPGGYRFDRRVEEHRSLKTPFRALAEASRMLGSTFMVLDADGPVRRAVPFVRRRDLHCPSLAVATAMTALGLQPAAVSVRDERLHLGERALPLFALETEYVDKVSVQHLLVRYAGPAYRDGARRERTYRTYNFWDLVLSEGQLEEGAAPAVDPAQFRGKILFIGTTAAGLHDLFQTPFGEAGKMPGMQIHASVVDNILSGVSLRTAPWWWGAALLAAVTLALGAAGVYLRFWWVLVSAAAAGGLTAWLALFSFRQGVWLPPLTAGTGLALALFGGVAYKYFVEDRAKRQVRALFSRYVSPDVVQELVDDPSRARLGGQRRRMTVLFSDIRGFTTLSEAGQPEDVIGQLNEYFTRMVELLFRHHGTLDKFVGDMIMGLFNAPVADADHADHAVQMALAMLRELDDLNARWRRESRPTFDIGIGINTGDMIVGNVGSERTLSYTVIGDHVNLGSRLESLNKQYGSHILISEFTRASLRGEYPVRPLGRVAVKGKTREVGVFEVCRTREELAAKERV